jgi:HNH endonuclease
MSRGVKGSEQECCVEGCVRIATNHGYCGRCWKRKLRHGDTTRLLTVNKGKKCLTTGCNRGALAKGYCQQHYDSVFKHGREYLILAPDGSGTITKDGYREFNIKGEKILEHVMLAEKALGRKLPPGVVVHHMNGDKLDNFTPFNLVICPDQAYHMLLHKRARDLETNNGTIQTTDELGL